MFELSEQERQMVSALSRPTYEQWMISRGAVKDDAGDWVINGMTAEKRIELDRELLRGVKVMER